MGLDFPDQYKDYVRIYGAGQWADFFGIMNPFYQWKHPQGTSYVQWMEQRLEGLDEMRKDYPQDTAPFNRHPAPSGLIPFGYDDNGGTLCFQVSGDPTNWPIVFLDGKLSQRYDLFCGSVAGFLLAMLHGKFQPKTWPPDVFPIKRPAFRPYTTE